MKHGHNVPSATDLIAKNPFAGTPIPELAREFPTTLLFVTASFTVRHVIVELQHHLEMEDMTPEDIEMLVELGKAAQRKQSSE